MQPYDPRFCSLLTCDGLVFDLRASPLIYHSSVTCRGLKRAIGCGAKSKTQQPDVSPFSKLLLHGVFTNWEGGNIQPNVDKKDGIATCCFERTGFSRLRLSPVPLPTNLRLSLCILSALGSRTLRSCCFFLSFFGRIILHRHEREPHFPFLCGSKS